MNHLARQLAVASVALAIAGVSLLGLQGVASAHDPDFQPHNEYASVVPYYLGVGQIISVNVFTDYGSQHETAISRWNTATLDRDYIRDYAWGGFSPNQILIYTSSDTDIALGQNNGVPSCNDFVVTYPVLFTYRAFAFGHTENAYGDMSYTVICLNHSAYTSTAGDSCTPAVMPVTEGTCFDDEQWPPLTVYNNEVRIKGLVHEMGHPLHLDHPCIGYPPEGCTNHLRKGAMSQDWAYAITVEEADHIRFIYAEGHTDQFFRPELNLAGYAAGLLECLTLGSPVMAPALTMSVYCYVNVPGIDVNPEGYPGMSGTGQPGGLPAGVYGDVGDQPAVLSGYSDDVTNIVHMSGCIEDRDGQAALGHVYVEWSWDKITGLGSASTWVNETQSNCLAGTPSGVADSTGSLELLDVMNQENPDYDGDMVPTEREFGTDAACGLRDPFNPYDYYDVSIPKDGVIDLPNDVLGVIQHFAPGGYPAGWENWDRPPAMLDGAGHWSRGEPDGIIDLPNDIQGVILQMNQGGCGLLP